MRGIFTGSHLGVNLGSSDVTITTDADYGIPVPGALPAYTGQTPGLHTPGPAPTGIFKYGMVLPAAVLIAAGILAYKYLL